MYVTSRCVCCAIVFVLLCSSLGTVCCGIVAASDGPLPPVPDEVKQTRSYNENMEYRRLGKTGLWLSAVSIGGHWKKIKHRFGSDDFKKNRREVLAACMDHGINFVDACTFQEVAAYPKALGKRREEMYISYSYDRREVRFKL